MKFSSGPILVNPGASTLELLISNDNTSDSATIQIELFTINTSASPATRIPFALQLFTVLPNEEVTLTFSIAGFSAYEIVCQVTGVSPHDLLISSFARDNTGKLFAAQRILQSELTSVI